MKIKVGGVWKDSSPAVKVSGSWNFCDTVFIKVAGVWKQTYRRKAGYLLGGTTQTTSGGTLVDNANVLRFNFELETNNVLSAQLSAITRAGTMPGVSNSGIAGYIAGGEGGSSSYSKIEKLLYFTETRSTLSATLPAAIIALSAVSNTGTAGYICGGYRITAPEGFIRAIYKLTYSTETISTISATLSTDDANITGFDNPKVAGYLRGGNLATTLMQKLTFSTESRSTVASGLGQSTGGSGITFASTRGYYNQGRLVNGTPTKKMYKMPYSTETEADIGDKLSSNRLWPGVVGDYLASGFFLGGNESVAGLNSSSIDKISFSTDNSSIVSQSLTTPVRQSASLSNNGIL